MSDAESRVKIRQGALSGRYYAITKWHMEGASMVADEKQDVTDDVEAILTARTADLTRELAEAKAEIERYSDLEEAHGRAILDLADADDAHAGLVTAMERLAAEWAATPEPPSEEYEGTQEGQWAFGEWLATTDNARSLRTALADAEASA